MKYFFVFLMALGTASLSSAQIRHDICDKIIVGDFKCTNCISSNEGIARLIRVAVTSHLNLDYTFCEVLNRDRLADILSRQNKESIISSLNDLTEEEKEKLTTVVKAQRVLFGEMEVQRDNSLLVTLVIYNLGSGVQETASLFEIPTGNYDTHSQREPYINKGIERMLLGKTDGKPASMPPKKEETAEKPTEPVATPGIESASIIWTHHSNISSIWKIDKNGNFLKDKVHSSISLAGWTLVNGFNDKILWRHSSGMISLWTIDADGNLIKFKEHGPVAGWTAISYADNKMLWRHSSGKISIWFVDDDGNQLHYKEHGPFPGWTALFLAKDNLIWKHTSGSVSIWKIDDFGNQKTYKEHSPIPDWTLVNAYNNKVLWRHTSGQISIWTIDADGNVQRHVEHGPIGDWIAVCYGENKILWRRPSGQVSLWTIDDNDAQVSYKDYGPIAGWTALYFTNKR